MEQDLGERIFDRATMGFLDNFGLHEDKFTPEERKQTEELEKKRGIVERQLAQLNNEELSIRKEVLVRNGLAATSLELLTNTRGEQFNAKKIRRDPFTHVEKHGETAYFCEPCQLWVKGKPKEQIFVSEGVVAYKCLVGEHPMGKGLFPFEL